MTIGERVKFLRSHLKLTQQEFANALDVDQGHIAGIEKGSKNPSKPLQKVICFTFYVNDIWLKTGEGEIFISPEETIKNQIARFGKRAIIDAYKSVVADDDSAGSCSHRDCTTNIKNPELHRMVKTLHDIWATGDERLKSWAAIQFDITFPRSIIEAITQHDSISQERERQFKQEFKQAETDYQPLRKGKSKEFLLHEAMATETPGLCNKASDYNPELIQKKDIQDDIDLNDILLVAHAEGREILRPLSPELKAIVKDAIKVSRQKREVKEKEATEDD